MPIAPLSSVVLVSEMEPACTGSAAFCRKFPPINVSFSFGSFVPIPTAPDASITNGVVSLKSSFTLKESPVPELVTFSPSVVPLAVSSNKEDGKLVPIPINPESSIIILSTPAVSNRILFSSELSSTCTWVFESSSTRVMVTPATISVQPVLVESPVSLM